MRTKTWMTAVAALGALVVAGCGDRPSGTEHAGNHSSSMTTGAPSGTASAAHNDADVMFAQHMIPHHSQAVVMGDILLAKQNIDPRVVELAGQIKAAQAPEIQQMQDWLTSWGNPSMPSMGGHGSMSGMVSDGDLDKLRQAQGVDAARLFLSQMIAHHEGAITMAQDEIKIGQYAPATAMAQSIVTTQQREIDSMRGILASL